MTSKMIEIKITKDWLKKKSCCREGYQWFLLQDESDLVAIIDSLMSEDRFDFANWLIARLLPSKQRQLYLLFASEKVLELPDFKGKEQKVAAYIATYRKYLMSGTKEDYHNLLDADPGFLATRSPLLTKVLEAFPTFGGEDEDVSPDLTENTVNFVADEIYMAGFDATIEREIIDFGLSLVLQNNQKHVAAVSAGLLSRLRNRFKWIGEA